MTSKYALLVAAALTLASAPVLADNHESKDAAPAAEATAVPAAPDFAKLDANSDGSLSKEEYPADGVDGKSFDDKDADKDGKVTKEEFEAKAEEKKAE